MEEELHPNQVASQPLNTTATTSSQADHTHTSYHILIYITELQAKVSSVCTHVTEVQR